MAAPPPRYKQPTSGPTATDVADAKRWDDLVDNALPSVQSAAEKWRTGLAAFVTIVTGGLIVKGPDLANDLAKGWRAAITVLAAAGLLATIIGLWLALRAAAGAPASQSYTAILANYGGVRQFNVANARKATQLLLWARVLVGTALVLIGAALILWWWAPTAAKKPPALISIDHDQKSTCGELLSADGRMFRVKVSGEKEPETVAFTSATNVRVVASCGERHLAAIVTVTRSGPAPTTHARDHLRVEPVRAEHETSASARKRSFREASVAPASFVDLGTRGTERSCQF